MAFDVFSARLTASLNGLLFPGGRPFRFVHEPWAIVARFGIGGLRGLQNRDLFHCVISMSELDEVWASDVRAESKLDL